MAENKNPHQAPQESVQQYKNSGQYYQNPTPPLQHAISVQANVNHQQAAQQQPPHSQRAIPQQQVPHPQPAIPAQRMEIPHQAPQPQRAVMPQQVMPLQQMPYPQAAIPLQRSVSKQQALQAQSTTPDQPASSAKSSSAQKPSFRSTDADTARPSVRSSKKISSSTLVQGTAPASIVSSVAHPRTRTSVTNEKRRMSTATILIVGIISFVLLSAGFLTWDRWFRYDDPQDFLGAWTYTNEQLSTRVTIDESDIAFAQNVSYGYTLNAAGKSILYDFGTMQGAAQYRFSADRNTLVIAEQADRNIFIDILVSFGLASPEDGFDLGKTTILTRIT